MELPKKVDEAEWLWHCPKCRQLGVLDADQYYGRVSIQCPGKGCNFHETIDWSKANGENIGQT